MRWMAWWMGAVLWVGCASQAADAVRVTHRTPKTPCEAVGRVEGQGTSEALARKKAREDAHQMGADTVVIDEPIAKLPAGRTRVRGAALRCHAPATPRTAEVSSPGAATAPAAHPGEASAVAGPAPAAAASGGVAPSEPGLEERLRSLQALHEKGLITQEDYDMRRKELLQEL